MKKSRGTPHPSSPRTPTTAEMARDAVRQLAPLLGRRPTKVVIRPEVGADAAEVIVPLPAFELFVELLGHLANGAAVTVIPHHASLTTQEAADLLNVSRPHVIKLIDEGRIPCQMVGRHRRVALPDLLQFKKDDAKRRRETIDKLAADGQDLGFDY